MRRFNNAITVSLAKRVNQRLASTCVAACAATPVQSASALLSANKPSFMTNNSLASNPYQASSVEVVMKPAAQNWSPATVATTSDDKAHLVFHYNTTTEAGMLTFLKISSMVEYGTLPGEIESDSWVVSREEYSAHVERHQPSYMHHTSTDSAFEWAPEFELTD